MNLAALGLGFLLVTIGVVFYSFQLPWIQFNPFPALTTLHPFFISALVCWWLGGIFIIMGIVRHNMVRLFLGLVFTGIVIYLNLSQILALVKI
jgi:hypothetical protein